MILASSHPPRPRPGPGPPRRRQGVRLGELLVRTGRVAQDKVAAALERQAVHGARLGTNLLELDALTEDALLESLSTQLGAPSVDHHALRWARPEVLSHLSRRDALAHRVIPFRVYFDALHFAAEGPVPLESEFAIAWSAGRSARAHVALEVRMGEALSHAYGVPLAGRFRELLERLEPARTGSPRRLHRLDSSVSTVTPRRSAKIPATIETPASARPSLPSGAAATSASLPERRADFGPEAVRLDGGPRLSAPRIHPPAATPPHEPGIGAAASRDLWFPSLTPLLRAALGTAGPADPRLDETSPAAAPETETTEVSLEGFSDEHRFELHARRLGTATARDEIGEVLLQYASAWFRRRILFYAQKDHLRVWRSDGVGVVPLRLDRLVLDSRGWPELRETLVEGELFCGPPARPLAPDLLGALGGVPPAELALVPLRLRGRTAFVLYLDNLREPVVRDPLPGIANLGRLAVDSLLLLARQLRASRS